LAEVESAPAAEPEPQPAEETAADLAPLALEDLEYGSLADGTDEPPPAGLQLEEADRDEEPVEPIAGLIGRDVDEPVSGDEFLVETNEDIVLRSSGGHEFQMPDAARELFSRAPAADPFGFGTEPASVEMPPVREPEPIPAPGAEAETVAAASPPADEPHAEPVPAAAEPEVEPEPIPVWDAPVAESPPAEPVPQPEPTTGAAPAAPPDIVAPAEPEMVVTETMAEVLRQQGHPVEALRVYRELEVRSAGDPRLLQRIAELEEESQAEPESPRRFTAAETRGQSVADFFQRLLAARPPAAPAPPAAMAQPSPAPAAPDAGGAPTRPAADALSLSSVFGEETAAAPPAVPAPGAPAGGVSFDEFFSPPGASAARTPRGPDAKNDDLDQFHAWLQNLKR
jgi:hypothetical protein